MMEDEKNRRLYNRHKHQALSRYQAIDSRNHTGNPPFYAFGPKVGQSVSPFTNEIR